MNDSKHKGFSLIELLIVVVIIGIIASLSIPYLVKAIGKAENTQGYAGLKVISKAQVTYFARNNRFAKLGELSADAGKSIGTFNDGTLKLGHFTIIMNPAEPDNSDLESGYEIIATKANTSSNTPCVISIDATGRVTEIFDNKCISAE